MNGICPSIRVANSDGNVVGKVDVQEGDQLTLNADGTLTTERRVEEPRVLVPEDTAIGQRIHREAAERGQTVENFVLDAVEGHLGGGD